MSDLGKRILQGANEALEYSKGQKKGARSHTIQVPTNIDVRSIRGSLQMTRKEFSEEFCFSLRTLEKWERGERLPEGPARAYLTVIAQNPHAVQKALSEVRPDY